MFSGYKNRDIPQPEKLNKPKVISSAPTDRNIIILWATVRPDMFKESYKKWIDRAVYKNKIKIIVGVDSLECANELNDFNVLLTKNTTPGVCFPCYCLSSYVTGNDKDIIVFASDDFTPPSNWDVYLYGRVDRDMILVTNDGIQQHNSRMVTIPIMTYAALCRLNKIIYHPAYTHMWSDCELYDLGEKLGIIVNDRADSTHIFSHNHYCVGTRVYDTHDTNVNNAENTDRLTYQSRKNLSATELMVIDGNVQLLASESIFIPTINKQPDTYLLTTIAPFNIENQSRCIKTWDGWGATIYSINSKSEIEILKPYFDNVTFIECDRNAAEYYGKPLIYLDDLLNCRQWNDADIICIVNSDIYFDDALFMNNDYLDLLNKAKTEPIIAHRFDVRDGQRTLLQYGIDVFLLSGADVKKIPPTRYAIGAPWWDYYIPLLSLFGVFECSHWICDWILHDAHPQNYSTESHIELGYYTMDAIVSKHMNVDAIRAHMTTQPIPSFYAGLAIIHAIWMKFPKLYNAQNIPEFAKLPSGLLGEFTANLINYKQ